MKALQLVSLDGPEGMRIVDIDPPAQLPNPYEDAGEPVVVSVRAAGVSFPEVLQSRGLYQFKPELPFVPGSEVAGVVEAAPAGSRFQPGDRVVGYSFVGGLAETALAPELLTFPLNDRLSFAEGAALIMNYQTAYFALVTRGRLRSGERVLVQGAAGGVGTAAIQVAKGLGAEVVAIVSDDAKEKIAREAGADHVFRSGGSWKDAVLSTMPEGVDIVVDPVGGDRLIDNLRVLREGGRFVVVGFADGEIPQIPSNRLLLKNIDAVGAMWFGYLMAHPEYAEEVGAAIEKLIESGHVRPIIGARFPLEHAADAFRHIEDRKGLGKVVVEIGAATP